MSDHGSFDDPGVQRSISGADSDRDTASDRVWTGGAESADHTDHQDGPRQNEEVIRAAAGNCRKITCADLTGYFRTVPRYGNNIKKDCRKSCISTIYFE